MKNKINKKNLMLYLRMKQENLRIHSKIIWHKRFVHF